MKTNNESEIETKWNKAYKAAWNRMFDALSKNEKQTVLDVPTGSTAAGLAVEATKEADAVCAAH